MAEIAENAANASVSIRGKLGGDAHDESLDLFDYSRTARDSLATAVVFLRHELPMPPKERVSRH